MNNFTRSFSSTTTSTSFCGSHQVTADDMDKMLNSGSASGDPAVQGASAEGAAAVEKKQPTLFYNIEIGCPGCWEQIYFTIYGRKVKAWTGASDEAVAKAEAKQAAADGVVSGLLQDLGGIEHLKHNTKIAIELGSTIRHYVYYYWPSEAGDSASKKSERIRDGVAKYLAQNKAQCLDD